MPVTNKNLPILHRKEWQMMTPLPSTSFQSQQGSYTVAAQSGNPKYMLYVYGTTSALLYNHNEDAWYATANPNFSGANQNGSCGDYHPWSITYTANGGSTTTITVAAATHNINGNAVGSTVEFISAGSSTGVRRTITAVDNSGGSGNITLTLDSAAPAAIANNHTFKLSTGRFFCLNGGTVAAGVFKAYDVGTGAWGSNLGTTNLPASIATSGRLVSTYTIEDTFATGTATSGGASTITNTAKTWTVNQWTNYEIRITAGTGIGQYRTIASNTADTITVGSAWSTQPDNTSQYEITGNSDFLYFIGNNAVTMYRYSISGNTWTVMAPTNARAAAPSTGLSATWVGKTGDSTWGSESNIRDGKYIYSFRGGNGAVLDRFDIAGGTSGAGSWSTVTYNGTAEIFGTGSCAFGIGKNIFYRKEATNRFFKFDVVANEFTAFATNLYPSGGANDGTRIWVKNYDSSESIQWLYSLNHTDVALHRIMLI